MERAYWDAGESPRSSHNKAAISRIVGVCWEDSRSQEAYGANCGEYSGVEGTCIEVVGGIGDYEGNDV
jgi:hypothetical protein